MADFFGLDWELYLSFRTNKDLGLFTMQSQSVVFRLLTGGYEANDSHSVEADLGGYYTDADFAVGTMVMYEPNGLHTERLAIESTGSITFTANSETEAVYCACMDMSGNLIAYVQLDEYANSVSFGAATETLEVFINPSSPMYTQKTDDCPTGGGE